MKLTYAITVCNEFVEIQRLVSFLLQHKRLQDNIVVLYDEANGDPAVEEYLRAQSLNEEFVWFGAKFDNHFYRPYNHPQQPTTSKFIDPSKHMTGFVSRPQI